MVANSRPHRHSASRAGRFSRAAAIAATAGLGAILIYSTQAVAYERYNDGCQSCHGAFTGPTSPKGTVFPGNDKHRMHRSSTYMGTNCNLCHTSGDNDNPYTGSSNGTANNRGLGCSGCHGNDYGGTIGVRGAGLRKHHKVNGVTVCGTCHTSDPTPLPESNKPPYYGTADTKCDDSCNSGPAFKENWSVGDTVGLDNDGDNFYDADDPDCKPCLPCDMDCNGTVNLFDIQGFVEALTGGTPCAACAGDTDANGTVNLFDIQGFVNCLSP